jgi:Uma2 family endonuclease
MMSVAPLAHVGPWTFDDLDQLPEDDWRYEVVDGALLMTPPRLISISPSADGSSCSWSARCLWTGNRCTRWLFRVRKDGRVPDLAIVRAGLPVRPREVAYQAADFGLLVEVVSPTSTGMDRVLKSVEYAAGGVPFFWRVETEPVVEVVGYELVDGAYRERARATQGHHSLPGPYAIVVDVDALT